MPQFITLPEALRTCMRLRELRAKPPPPNQRRHLSPDTLSHLADQFRADLFAAAGTKDPKVTA